MIREDIRDNSLEQEDVMNDEMNPGQDEELLPEEEAADNVSDESFETGDKSAQMADAAKEWQDKYIRLSAEFDNYRKRTLKEKMELISTGCEDVIKPILGVLDDMERAIIATDKSDDIESARQGMRLIQQKLIDVLRQKGVSEIEAVGQELDTDVHEAVAKFPSEDQKGKIIDVVQKGYKLKDKVVRFSKVVVGE